LAVGGTVSWLGGLSGGERNSLSGTVIGWPTPAEFTLLAMKMLSPEVEDSGFSVIGQLAHDGAVELVQLDAENDW
jgi:hypothetical protein